MSWEDEIYQASPGVERALVYLERAQGRNSKRAAEADIENAITEAFADGDGPDLNDLLARYDLPWSLDGLVEVAVHFSEELRNISTLSAEEKVEKALEIAVENCGETGADHLMWVVDQIVRVLAGDQYPQVVADAMAGEEGPDTYIWWEGAVP